MRGRPQVDVIQLLAKLGRAVVGVAHVHADGSQRHGGEARGVTDAHAER